MHYAVIDIGASSGRVMIGYIEQDVLHLKEIHRFINQFSNINNELCWDLNYLFLEIITGLKKSKEMGLTPQYVSIDTWGVDFVFLDANDKLFSNTVAYRDERTKGMDKIVAQKISPQDLYKRTGIQYQPFNTIYQLVAIKQNKPHILKKAKSFLMIPDYLNFLLTGIKTNEYTNATTTQLVNVKTNQWDIDLMNLLDIPSNIFQPIKSPGTIIGKANKEVQDMLGYSFSVISGPSHDTASAALGTKNSDETNVFISSGTWSLVGQINQSPVISKESQIANFSNSGGYNNTFLYLKNIIGLWLIQEVYQEYNGKYSFSLLAEEAEKETIKSIIDCNDIRFLAPTKMIEVIQTFCEETHQQIPVSPFEIAAVIYNSLAISYKKTIQEITKLSGKLVKTIQVVGGGSQVEYLNRQIAMITGLNVTSGPIEATAIGNLICQMLTTLELKTLGEANDLVNHSFPRTIYKGVKHE